MRLFASLCFGTAAACAVLLIPFTVLGADAAVAGVPAMDNPWWHVVLVNVLIGLGSVVLGLLGRGLTLAFDYLAEKTDLAFLARVDDMAMDIVTDIYNKEVKHAKAAMKDGKLTKHEREQFASVATLSLKSWLGPKGIKKLSSVFNGSAEHAIVAKIEKAVAVSKNAGKLARSSEIAKALGAAANPPLSSASPR